MYNNNVRMVEVKGKRQLKGCIFVIFLIVILEMKTLQSCRLWFVSYFEKSFLAPAGEQRLWPWKAASVVHSGI